MRSNAAIRRASPADGRAIARVHVETWRSTYAGILPDRVMIDMRVEEKAAQWRKLISRQTRREVTLVAIAPGAGIVGFASGGPAAGAQLPYEGEIHTLYVLPDFQERGIGRLLLRGCFGALHARGMNSAFLWVLAQNPSRFFYEAMGGKRVGERDETLWGVVVQEAAYAWPDLAAYARTVKRDG